MEKKYVQLLVYMLVLLIALTQATYAQESQPVPKKVYEYGDINCEDFSARLDGFAIEVQNDVTSKVYIIIYPGRKLQSRNFSHFTDTKNYLAHSRGISRERIVILRGDEREELKVELWLVPEGATSPKPEPQPKLEEENLNTPIKFDEDYPEYPFELYGDCCVSHCTLRQISFKRFAEALTQKPGATGYFIIYKGEDASLKTTRRIMRQVRQRMIRKYHFSEKRIKVVYGGRRDYREMEIWIVPKGAAFPKPTPKGRKL